MLRGNASAGGAARLGSFEFLAVRHAAADFLDDFAQGGAHRDFNQAGMLDFAAEREYLGALGFFRANRIKPIRAL